MITSISLERFRGFRETAIELKPLTVLLGANSAGKSSFLHALAALHFIRRLRLAPATLLPIGATFSSWPLDFGTRATFQREGSLSEGGVRVALGVRDAAANEAEIAYEFGRAEDMSLDLTAIEIDEKTSASVAVDRVVVGDTMNLTGPTTIDAGEQRGLQPRTGRWSVREVEPGSWRGPNNEAVSVTLANLELQHYYQGGTLSRVSSKGQAHLLELLEGVRYLRASRAEPRRQYEPRPAQVPADDVGPIGEWAAETWLACKGSRVEYRLPPPARIDREEAARLLTTPTSAVQDVLFEDAVDRWMHHLGVAKRAIAEHGDGLSMSVDVNGVHRGLPDVGFGVSQALPIVIQGLALPAKGTLLVEQPEAQLHPWPQAQLADFFCDIVERGHNCLIETHSEAFFRRLHLRTLLDPDLASRVAVYFVDAVTDDGCRNPVRVPLEVEGAVNWPKGFLAEGIRAHSAFAAVRAAIAARPIRANQG